MSKYEPLSKRLSSHPQPEWRASFAEIEEVLGFPLPRSARAGRSWWASAGDKAPARAWTNHGWSAEPDPAGGAVTFRRGDASPSALDAALQAPGPEPAEAAPPALSAPHEVQPEVLKEAAVTASRQMHAKSWGVTAAVAGAAALVAGVGALVVRGMLRRARNNPPPPS